MALKAGAIRFNTDTSQMEIWDGNQWTGVMACTWFALVELVVFGEEENLFNSFICKFRNNG